MLLAGFLPSPLSKCFPVGACSAIVAQAVLFRKIENLLPRVRSVLPSFPKTFHPGDVSNTATYYT